MSSSPDDALAFLLSRVNYERAARIPYTVRDFKLSRMRELLDRLGNPQAGLPIVHVAGTKGKGSTAAMTASVLQAAGYRAGLYSSPHLLQIEERVAVDGRSCPPAEFAELVLQLRPHVEAMDAAAEARSDAEHGPTYFELLTALALLHFARERADVAVLEVGLGGRLDSTNVCEPSVCAITSISFDHMRQLGNTLAAIAGEKAGIIKSGVPVVSGVLAEEPQRVISQRALELGAPLWQLGRDFEVSYHPPALEAAARARIDLRSDVPGNWGPLDGLELALLGRHQAENAAVALAVLAVLRSQGWQIPATAIRAGLAAVHWPARVEVLGRRPTVVLDAAHNAASVAALLQTLRESFPARRRWLIFASSRDKEYAAMVRQLAPECDVFCCTEFQNNPRAVSASELPDLARAAGHPQVEAYDCVADAWRAVQARAGADDLVFVTGSFFLAAEFRACWSGAAPALSS